MGLPFLYEVIAESMWRAMGWACDERSNVAINTPKKRFTDGEARDCTHTPCRAHIFPTHFPCVTYRRCVHAWLTVFALRMSYLSISPSPFSCFIHRLYCSRTVCTFLAELFPIRMRGSSALPHERRGIWLPGRSDALRRLSAQRVRQGHFCGR